MTKTYKVTDIKRVDGVVTERSRRTISGEPDRLTLADVLLPGSKREDFRIRVAGSREYSPQDFDKTFSEEGVQANYGFEVEANTPNPYAES